MPQKDPEFYKKYFRSFNVPVFIGGGVNVFPYRLDVVV